MTDNSKQMSLEEKLVQKFKEIGLGALITDEDAITELTKRAIQEALFQPVKIPDRYGGYTMSGDSPVVEAAREIAKKLCTDLITEMVDKMKADPKVMEAVRDVFVATLPVVIKERVDFSYNSIIAQASIEAVNTLKNVIPR